MPFLPEAVDSILYQSFTDFELLLLDDGSTDDTRIYMETIHDPRVICIYNERNLGIDGSRNKAFALAKAPYIAPMDADDFALAERLAIQYDFMERNPNVLASGGNISIYETGEVWKYPSDPRYASFWTLFNAPIAHSASIFRKQDTYEITHGYPPNLSPSEDYGLWALLLMSGRGDLTNVDKPLLRYRTHPGRDRGKYHQIMNEQADKIRKQLCRWFWGKSFNDTRFLSHKMIAGSCLINSAKDINLIIKYLADLIDVNCQKNFLNQSQFEILILEQWISICNTISSQLLLITPLLIVENLKKLKMRMSHRLAVAFLKIFLKRFYTLYINKASI